MQQVMQLNAVLRNAGGVRRVMASQVNGYISIINFGNVALRFAPSRGSAELEFLQHL